MLRMSFSLSKFLALAFCPEKKRDSQVNRYTSELINKKNNGNAGGGDFYTPFWADAKSYAAGETDLVMATNNRIEVNHRRKRLYPVLAKNFVSWWSELRRGINEKIEVIQEPASDRMELPNENGHVNINNCLILRIGGVKRRYIFPYFNKDIALSAEAARIGIWMIDGAIDGLEINQIYLFDVCHGKSFHVGAHPMIGDEKDIFETHSSRLTKEISKRYKEKGSE